MKKTGAVLVAAGLSSRMHDFKPLLPYGNSTISLHNVTMLKKLGLDPIVVITGFRADDLESHLFSTGVMFVKNERFWETQMFDSVKLGIREIKERCDRILIMPMDMPAILPETFRLVLHTDAPIVRTKYGEHTGHPIVLRSDVAEQMLCYTGDNGLKGAVAASSVEVCDIAVEDEGVCRDVDTPEQYRDLIEWNYRRGKGYPVKPKVEISLMANEEFFGAKTAELLQEIERTGSRQVACAKVGISYSKATNLIKKAEQQLGFPIVERWTGGTGGGGSCLTAEGRELLGHYREMVSEVQKSTEEMYRKHLEKEFGSG